MNVGGLSWNVDGLLVCRLKVIWCVGDGIVDMSVLLKCVNIVWCM